MKNKINAGDFVKVGGEYGMCNGLYGGRVAFVTSQVKNRESRFVRQGEEIEICETQEEKEAARNAALVYYTLELQGIKRRLKNWEVFKEIDCKETLLANKKICEYWINVLSEEKQDQQ